MNDHRMARVLRRLWCFVAHRQVWRRYARYLDDGYTYCPCCDWFWE